MHNLRIFLIDLAFVKKEMSYRINISAYIVLKKYCMRGHLTDKKLIEMLQRRER